MTEAQSQDQFDDIRPYNDAEFTAVMARLIDDPELADTLLSIRHPLLHRYFSWALRGYIRRALHRRFDALHTVRDLQMLIGEQMARMLERSNSVLTVSGVENLCKDTAYLFVSNHRDIAMDPAYVNYALHQNGMDTVRIAIGDNLLSKPFASDLMRLNRSFIVRRSVKGRREKLRALTKLSHYIQHSLLEDRTSVWIAQREGRAKNGLDRTEPAVLKMFGLHRPRGRSYGEIVATLNIVPVAISYMFDPCDLDKAREIHQRSTTGAYTKSPHEDLVSLHKGIVGYKGAVHVAFGNVVTADDDVDNLAAQIDRQIIANYRLHPTNLIAWERLNGPDTRIAHLKAGFADCDWVETEEKLIARVARETEAVRHLFLQAYANPVQSRLDLDAGRVDSLAQTAGEGLG